MTSATTTETLTDDNRVDDKVRFEAISSESAAPFSVFGDDDRLKVVVVGAGFAGLATAIACARQGMKVTVIEKGSFSKHGDNITIGSNASRVLARWGLHDDFWQVSAKGGFWILKDAEGHNLRSEDVRDL